MIMKLTSLFLFLLLAMGGRDAAAQAPAGAQPFLAHCAMLAQGAEAENKTTVAGKDGWLFLAAELRHLGVGQFWGEAASKVSRATRPDNADPLPAIADFHAQLQAAGVEFLVLPVPPKAVIYPGKTGISVDERPDPYHQAFYALLRGQGVAVVDLVTALPKKEGKMYCQQDSHWSGAGCVAAASALATEIKKRGWFAARPKKAFTSAMRTVAIKGDLVAGAGDAALTPEELSLRFVSAKDGNQPVPDDPASPVLLLGDSHTLVFHAGGDMHAAGAGLADQLALELGFAVDVIGVRGSGATPARVNLMRKTRANPTYLMSKKLVIWCFAAREFTESDGWAKVPLTK